MINYTISGSTKHWILHWNGVDVKPKIASGWSTKGDSENGQGGETNGGTHTYKRFDNQGLGRGGGATERPGPAEARWRARTCSSIVGKA